ncbi:hypothetical protein DPY74_10365 [Salmonella enterica subsp. salamae]|nr:hypothetical protein [Salmonella enterica subsp. salamae]
MAARIHPSHIVIYVPGDSFACRLATTRNLSRNRFCFLFRAVAALAALSYPSHVVRYAPGDIFACRLATTRNLSRNRPCAVRQSATTHKKGALRRLF